MRHVLILPFLSLAAGLATPALAQESRPTDEMVERLNDPAFQDNMVTMMTGLMTAMKDLPIGQIAGVMGNVIPDHMRSDGDLAEIDPDATLGDYARHKDPDFDHDAEEKLRQGTAMMGAMAEEFAALVPQIQSMIKTMKDRTERTD